MQKEEAYDTKQNNMYNGFKEVIHLSGFHIILILFLNTLDSVDKLIATKDRICNHQKYYCML